MKTGISRCRGNVKNVNSGVKMFSLTLKLLKQNARVQKIGGCVSVLAEWE